MMYVSLQFQNKADKTTAEEIFSTAAPNVGKMFHFKAGEGYRLSANLDYQGYDNLLSAVLTVNSQLPSSVLPFEVITKPLELKKSRELDFTL